MRRHWKRADLVLAMAAVGLVGLPPLAMGAEEAPTPAPAPTSTSTPAPTPTPGGFIYTVENPVPDTLPFRLTGGFDIGGVGLPGGERNSPNLRTYRVIEEGFVANRVQLGVETKDQRWFMNFRGLDLSKNDQNYQVSLGQYGRYRLDLDWDQIPHLYAEDVKSPYILSPGGIYNLPTTIVTSTIPLSACPAGPAQATCRLRYQQGSFNDSNVFDLQTRNDVGRAGFWWAPTPELEFQLKYDHTRRAGNRPMGAGFGTPGGDIVEMPEPIDWKTDQLMATLGYSTPMWQVQGGYSLSIFGNDIKTMTFDNPFYNPATCSATGTGNGCPRQGRDVLAPDNQAHNWFVTGGVNLPMATRITAKVAYGINLQNDTFVTDTINGVMLAKNPFLSNAYFAPSLHGDLRTTLGTVTLTSRPLQDVAVTANYRYYATDNFTLHQSFPGYAIRDASTATTGRFSIAPDYQKENADLDVSYHILRALTLRAGFGWEQWDRSPDREVGRTDEYSGKFGASYKPWSWLDTQARYIVSWKRISDYNPFDPKYASYFPQGIPSDSSTSNFIKMRKIDEAARDRQRAELTFRFTPLENLEAGIVLGVGEDSYPFTYTGVLSDKNWSGAVDVGYTPAPWLTLRASNTFERYHMKQREATASIQLYNPTTDWESKNTDTYDTLGAGAIVRLIPNKLELTADYAYQMSIAGLNTFNPQPPVGAGVTATTPVASFPSDHFTLQRVQTALRYWLLKNLALRMGYTYERFRESYWQTDFIQQMNTTSGLGTATDVFLGAQPFRNYEVHIIAGGISYGF